MQLLLLVQDLPKHGRCVARCLLLILGLTSVLTLGCSSEEQNVPLKTVDQKIVFCSQNLNNLAASQKGFQKKLGQLTKRFISADCDLIALQEVSGQNKIRAERNLSLLSAELNKRSDKVFRGYVGDSNDQRIRNGFLAANTLGKVFRLETYADKPVTRLNPRGPSLRFTRGPLSLEFEPIPGLRVTAFSMHLKSKAGAWKDRTKTRFELLRMAMANSLRKLALSRIGKRSLVVILGDRNSEPESASAGILEGELNLADFRVGAACQLTEQLEASCSGLSEREPVFSPLLASQYEKVQRLQYTASYRYRGRLEIIDEILVPVEQVQAFRDSKGDLRVGTEGTFGRGSDHKLIWAELDLAKIRQSSGGLGNS